VFSHCIYIVDSQDQRRQALRLIRRGLHTVPASTGPKPVFPLDF
jgi:hypothetical protein